MNPIVLLMFFATASLAACIYDDETLYQPRKENEYQRPSDAGTGQNSAQDAARTQTANRSPQVTGLLVQTCNLKPPALALPRYHLVPRCRERARVIPYHEQQGKISEVKTPIIWTAADPSWVEVQDEGDDGWQWNVSGRAFQDIFDTDGTEEPQSLAQACATNDCDHSSDPENCEKIVCAEIPVTGVVNLEGEWCFSGANLGPGCVKVGIIQDGRELQLDPWNAKGQVADKEVVIKDDTTLWVGTVSPDRAMITGTATDLMNGEAVPDWTAVR